jgi:hypothetical protein
LCLRHGIILNRQLRCRNNAMIMKYFIVDKIFEILNVSKTISIDILLWLSRLIFEVYYKKSYNFGKVCSGLL